MVPSNRRYRSLSKQFQIYALPSDVERLVQTVMDREDIVLISPTSNRAEPTWLQTPIQRESLLPAQNAVSAKCCLIPNGKAHLALKYDPFQSLWRVTDESEAILMSGCDFDGGYLIRGRMYVQTDYLRGGVLVKKSLTFLRWVDRVFSLSKQQLHRSKSLDAYVGDDALEWERQGGKFVEFPILGRVPFLSEPTI